MTKPNSLPHSPTDLPPLDLFATAQRAVADIDAVIERAAPTSTFTQALCAQAVDRLGKISAEVTWRDLAARDAGTLPMVSRQIDHTLLKPTATAEQIVALCKEATAHQFAAVCVHPRWVKTAQMALNTDRSLALSLAAVVGFPFGANDTRTKVLETTIAVEDGANEIDMVADLSAIAMHDYQRVFDDIQAVSGAVGAAVKMKVIIEAGLHSLGQIALATTCVTRLGCAFVKTSTGVLAGGAQPEHVALMSALCAGTATAVKASGGIRDAGSARQMLALGAARLGTSSGIAIVSGNELHPPVDSESAY